MCVGAAHADTSPHAGDRPGPRPHPLRVPEPLRRRRAPTSPARGAEQSPPASSAQHPVTLLPRRSCPGSQPAPCSSNAYAAVRGRRARRAVAWSSIAPPTTVAFGGALSVFQTAGRHHSSPALSRVIRRALPPPLPPENTRSRHGSHKTLPARATISTTHSTPAASSQSLRKRPRIDVVYLEVEQNGTTISEVQSWHHIVRALGE